MHGDHFHCSDPRGKCYKAVQSNFSSVQPVLWFRSPNLSKQESGAFHDETLTRLTANLNNLLMQAQEKKGKPLGIIATQKGLTPVWLEAEKHTVRREEIVDLEESEEAAQKGLGFI